MSFSSLASYFTLGITYRSLLHWVGANVILIESYAAIADIPDAQEPLLYCSWDWLQEKHDGISLADEMPEEAAEIEKNDGVGLWDTVGKMWMPIPKVVFSKDMIGYLLPKTQGRKEVMTIPWLDKKDSRYLPQNQPAEFIHHYDSPKKEYSIDWPRTTLSGIILHELQHTDHAGVGKSLRRSLCMSHVCTAGVLNFDSSRPQIEKRGHCLRLGKYQKAGA